MHFKNNTVDIKRKYQCTGCTPMKVHAVHTRPLWTVQLTLQNASRELIQT